MLETLDLTIRIGSTPTFLYFDLYLYSAYAALLAFCKTTFCTYLQKHEKIHKLATWNFWEWLVSALLLLSMHVKTMTIYLT